MHKKFIADKYKKNFVAQNLMGPNVLILLEELVENVSLKRGMRVLDLGCGHALSSIFLAKEFGVQVFAVDLWIEASDNYKRILQMGLDDLVIPIHSDANQLPFADEYFDALISIDAYQYFGNNDTYYDEHLKHLLKKDALVAIAVPGMKNELGDPVPDEMKPFWPEKALNEWHAIDWWKERLGEKLKDFEIKEMKCFDRAWDDWLSTENPYAIEDRKMIAVDNGRYMNIISITGRAI